MPALAYNIVLNVLVSEALVCHSAFPLCVLLQRVLRMEGQMMYHLQEATIWKTEKEHETLSNNVANVLAANMNTDLFVSLKPQMTS